MNNLPSLPSEEGSMLLEEEIDENYEPNEEEIIEYAKYLGMNPSVDEEYFYIAKEGLKAPLPDNWKPYKNSKGEIYYIDLNTNQIVYEHPCDEHFRKLFEETKNKQRNSLTAKESILFPIENKKISLLLNPTLSNEDKLSTSNLNNINDLISNDKQENSASKKNMEENKNKEVSIIDCENREKMSNFSKFMKDEDKSEIYFENKDEHEHCSFQLVNDSFSDHCNIRQSIYEKSKENSGWEEENVDDSQKRKEKEFLEEKKKLQQLKKDEITSIQADFESKINQIKIDIESKTTLTLKENKKNLQEKIKAEYQDKFKHNLNNLVENFESKKNILLEKFGAIRNQDEDSKKKECLKITIEEIKNKIERIKSNINAQEIINEKTRVKFNFNLEKDMREGVETEYMEKLKDFERREKIKRNKKIKELEEKFENEFEEYTLKIKTEEAKKRNSLMALKTDLKIMLNKRLEAEKNNETERMKNYLISYENDLKQKVDINMENDYEKMQKQTLISLRTNPNSNSSSSLLKEINKRKDFQKCSSFQNKNSYLALSCHRKKQNCSLDKIHSLRREWLNLIIRERNHLELYKSKLNRKGTQNKSEQKILVSESSHLKKEIQKYKKNKANTSFLKETLKETKKDLLARIKFLNQRIFNLKEQEFNFKNKENALSCLENLILEMTNENFDNEQLLSHYKLYKMINLQPLDMESDLNEMKEEFSLFYQNINESQEEKSLLSNDWNDLLQNSFLIDLDASNTSNEEAKQSFLNKKSHNRSLSVKNRNRLNDSLYRIKEKFLNKNVNQVFQIENKNFLLDNDYSRNESIFKCLANKNKAQKIFNDHSSWLRNIKNELNRSLYSKSFHLSSKN